MAISLCGDASKIISYEKKEGGYNRNFILIMDTGKRVIAKGPTPIAGPPKLTVNSEVATVAYYRQILPNTIIYSFQADIFFEVQSNTSLPIPKILAWSDDCSNPVGAEYIIQEHVDGVQLHEHWPSMDTVQHMLCVKELSFNIRGTASLDFLAYGNIYFADVAIHESLKISLGNGFCIGPYCSPIFWNCSAGEPELYNGPSPNRGPCS